VWDYLAAQGEPLPLPICPSNSLDPKRCSHIAGGV